jgi:hypothetical protein
MLRVIYELDPNHDTEIPMSVEESRGLIKHKCSPAHFTPQAVAALNATAEAVLAGEQWFQIWQGEIVSMASPETPQEDGTVARLHRGSVVHKAS